MERFNMERFNICNSTFLIMKIAIEFESDEIQPDDVYESEIMSILTNIYGGNFRVINKMPTGKITFSFIEKAVCNHVKCLPEEIQARTRKREVVEARQICHYLSRNAELGTLSSIGFRFGKKDHATVISSIRTVANLLQVDFDFQSKHKSFIESFN